jgi:glycosyltransferase involved in cell wall biosynthesis
MVERPLQLSVVIPNYNHARFLPEALDAILMQSYQPVEIVIIDDASTDNSIDVIEGFQRQNPRIRVVRNEKNMGVIYNLNELLRQAAGDYVLFAAADDKVLPGFFECCMTILAAFPSAGLCSTASKVIDDKAGREYTLPNILISESPSYLSPARSRELLFRTGNWIEGNATIYRKAALSEVGGYPPELASLADSFIAHVIALYHGACFVPKPLAMFRRQEAGYSARTWASFETRRAVLDAGVRLMRTRFRDIFPSDYVQIWEDEMLFQLMHSASTASRRQRLQLLGEIRQTRGGMTPIRITERLVRLLLHCEAFLTLAHLGTVFRPQRIFRRNVKKLIQRRGLRRLYDRPYAFGSADYL